MVDTTEKGGGAETEESGEQGDGEEEKEISYNYDELKSGPEVVNISKDIYLQLQYPSMM